MGEEGRMEGRRNGEECVLPFVFLVFYYFLSEFPIAKIKYTSKRLLPQIWSEIIHEFYIYTPEKKTYKQIILNS